jgi:hypothetical protein
VKAAFCQLPGCFGAGETRADDGDTGVQVLF